MFTLRLLGGAALEGDGEAVSGRAGQPRRLALLALLASAPKGTSGREKLIAYLWPDSDTEQGRHLLKESLYVLRRVLGGDTLLSEGDNVRLNPERISTDLTEFEAALERGDLKRAVRLYAGPFLDGFFLKGAQEFERWVETERAGLAQEYAIALESLAEQAEQAKEFATAAEYWRRLAAHDPYNSRIALRLMNALARAGDPANAIHYAKEHMRLLQVDLGVQPPEDLQTFVEQHRRQWMPPERTGDAVPATDAPVAEPQLEAAPPCRPPVASEVEQHRWIFTWRSAQVALLGVVVISAIVVALWQFGPRGTRQTTPAGAAVDPANRIAVLPFAYSGEEESAYLGETMIDLLSVTLDGVGDLQTVDPGAVLGVVAQASGEPGRARGRHVAERLGAGLYVQGEVLAVGGRLRIDARLHSVGADSGDVTTATVEGETNEYMALVDGLTRQLLLGSVEPPGQYDRLAARTTDSLSALKAYLEGVVEHKSGRLESAFAAFRRAAEIDSTFALAWYGMAVAASWPGMIEWEAAMEAAERAVRHSEQLPARARGVVRAYSSIMHGDAREAERLSREVLSRYPNDVEAMDALAWTLNSFSPLYGRQLGEDRELFETVYRLDPQDPDHQMAAAWCAAKEGDWARLDSLWGQNLLTRSMRAFGGGDEAAQEQVISEARRAADASPLRASRTMQIFLTDIPAAAELARLAVLDALPPDSGAWYGLWVAQLEVGLGRWRAADTALARVSTLRPRWVTLYRALWASSPFSPVSYEALQTLFDSLASWDAEALRPSVTHVNARAHDLLASQLRLYVLGRLSLRLGDADSALRYAAELEETGNPRNALSYAIDRAQSLRGHVLFARGQLEEALEAMEAQPRRTRIQWLFNVPFYASPEDRFLRGEILVELGRFNDALRWYQTIGEVYAYDVDYLAVAHLRQAEVYEKLGQRDNAALHYKQFLHAWQHCDPELQPLVEQARHALNRLTGERLMP